MRSGPGSPLGERVLVDMIPEVLTGMGAPSRAGLNALANQVMDTHHAPRTTHHALIDLVRPSPCWFAGTPHHGASCTVCT
jgi:hypothetical protein